MGVGDKTPHAALGAEIEHRAQTRRDAHATAVRMGIVGVSSLHDGMNLVAKEYVASRFDHDGVLILSPFTGAALELTDALIVNPYDVERFSDSIRQAVEMPRLDRQMRMANMRAVVQENNIYKWAARSLVDMMQVGRRAHRPIRSV